MLLKKIFTKNHFDLALRWYLAFFIGIYGFAKLIGGQFSVSQEILNTPVCKLSGMRLTWAFFSHSFIYTFIIGGIQMSGSLLLLFNRTKLIGTVLLIPVMVNIVLVDIFYEVLAGALYNAVFYLAGLIILLFLERERVVQAVKVLCPPVLQNINWRSVLISCSIIVMGFVAICLVEQLFDIAMGIFYKRG